MSLAGSKVAVSKNLVHGGEIVATGRTRDFMTASRRIVVAGAGSIGCFVGGMLAAAGLPVALLARRRIVEEISAYGLRVTTLEGIDKRVSPGALFMSEDPSVLRDAGIVLVCVKSADTAAMGAIIAAHAPPDAVIVSLQNGVANTGVLQALAAGQRVLAGMVPFNVVAMGKGRFHRATSGDIVIAGDEAATAARLSVPDLKVQTAADMTGLQWGKLLLNLNNALNALSGLPLRQQLSQRRWRCLLADQIAEALMVLTAAGVEPAAMTPLPPSFIPFVLRLPDWAFRIVAGSMIRIDPQARSSMWEDLQRGRRTEIDYLQGAVLDLARQHTCAAPLSSRILTLIKAAEGARHARAMTPDDIRRGL
jgi:2-dehydropantoate 2-reductase